MGAGYPPTRAEVTDKVRTTEFGVDNTSFHSIATPVFAHADTASSLDSLESWTSTDNPILAGTSWVTAGL